MKCPEVVVVVEMVLMLVKYRSEDTKQTEDQRRRQRGPAAVRRVGL